MTLWAKIKNEFLNPHSHLRHKIPMDAARALADYTGQFVNKNMPPNSQRWLDENANDIITRVVIKRAPVSKNIERFLDLASGGRFSEGKEQLGYDDFFHLSIVIEHQYMPYGKGREGQEGPVKHSQLEKLERVSFSSRISEAPNTEALEVTIPAGQQVGRVVRTWMNEMGDNFFPYNAFDNNCQTFVAGFLTAMGVLNAQTKSFVYQNAGQLLKKQPGYLGDLARSITNLGAIANQTIQGGRRRRGRGITNIFRNASRSYSKAVSTAVNTVWKQVKDKDSLTRKHLIPVVKDIAKVAQPILDVYAPGSGTAVKAVADSIDCANNVAKSVGYGRAERHKEMEQLVKELNSILTRVNNQLMPLALAGDESVRPKIEELIERWHSHRARIFALANYPAPVAESESESESESEPDAEMTARGRGQLRRRIGKAMNGLLE